MIDQTLSQIYRDNSEQITEIVKNRPQMWAIGFNNGVISRAHFWDQSDSSSPALTTDYQKGYAEGMAFMIYKRSQKSVSIPNSLIKPEDVIVGYVVQNYDFSRSAIGDVPLGKRQSKLMKLIYGSSSLDKTLIGNIEVIKAEELKLLRIREYLIKGVEK